MFNKILMIVIGLFIMGFCTAAFAQQNHQLSGNEMDFWVGEWDLTWSVNNQKGTGHNSVTKTLGGAVIHEHFRGIEGPYGNYLGESFTSFHPGYKAYFQTWVDMNGSYADYEFTQEEGKYMFGREADFGKGPFKVRMVFYDIKPNSFTWDWQRFNTETKEWDLNWRINYQRNKIIEGLNIDRFKWITGRWKNSQTGDYEVWKYTDDKSSLTGYAVSYNEEKNDSTLTEQLQIVEREGQYIFIAHPSSSDIPTEFSIISATDKNFVSYNPDHDFPQRVEYHRMDENRLGAVIKDNKKSMKFLFVREID